MIEDPIELLARANPVPGSVTPAPFEDLLARIDDGAPMADRVPVAPRRARLGGFVVPALGIGVALAVAAAAILLIDHPARTAPAHVGSHSTPAKPRRPTPAPSGGMRGTVLLTGVAFTSSADGVVSLQQCEACARSAPRVRDWLATTRDAGAHWKVVQAAYSLQNPVFSGLENGWAFGDSASREALYYVTHDGGVSWAPAHLTGGQFPYTTTVAVAGGVAWAVGNRCVSGGSCTYAVMRGAASGSTLEPTVVQPAPSAATMSIVAGSARTAYATVTTNGGPTSRTYATHDDGNHWATITMGCRGEARPAAVGDAVLWNVCGAHTIATSDDGGRHWHVQRITVGFLPQLVPVSATTAWAVTSHSALVRTIDGGRTWHAYLDPATKNPAGYPGTVWPLGVLSATSAAIASDYPTGHGRTQIMVGRSIGPANRSSFIELPPGLR
jgi:photosystem II stability/assembly factor-like uncharacterized protein